MKNFKRTAVLTIICMVGFVSTALAEEITVVGTGDGMEVFEVVGKAFSQLNPEVILYFPKSIGSSGGIKAVGRDEYALGRAARGIKDNEKSYGLTHAPFAKTPVVFYTNKEAGVQNLSAQQILDIYSGTITNWNEVGGNDVKIRVVTREPSDASSETLQKSFPGFADITVTSKSKMAVSAPETIAIAEKTMGVIAYGPYADAKKANVDILQIDNVNASGPDYPYGNTLALIFKQKNYSGNIKKFVEFATSEAAHEAIKEAGGIPF